MDGIRRILTKPPAQYAVAAGYLLATGAYVYFIPHSLLGFLFFMGSILVVSATRIDPRAKIGLAILALGLGMPMIGSVNRYYLDVATQVGIYAALALGLNVVVGFSGLLDLGYVAFYASGAYLYAVFASPQAAKFLNVAPGTFPLSGDWFWFFLAAAVALAALMGILLGLPVLRLRGDYLAIVTLGFGEIIRILLNNLDKPVNFTNGPNGITPVQPPAIFGYKLDQPLHFYFIVIIILALVLIIVRRLENSRIGRAWAAIREDETAALAMGIPLVKAKLLAFAVGASFAGAMGVVFASKQTFVDPSSFSFMESIGVLAMVILGGMGSIPGVVVGATAVVVLQLQVLKSLSEYLGQLRTAGVLNIPTQFEPAKYERFVFGLILILMMIFRSEGIVPARRPRVNLGVPDEKDPSPAIRAGDPGKEAPPWPY